jgi:hypothetical protein
MLAQLILRPTDLYRISHINSHLSGNRCSGLDSRAHNTTNEQRLQSLDNGEFNLQRRNVM